MVTFFTALHVVAAIILLGPVVVSTSMFPKQAAESRNGGEEATGRASVLHKVTTTYGMLSVLVPLLGAVVMASDWGTYKTNYFLHTAIILSVIAWGLLFFLVIPQQRKMMGSLGALSPAEGDASDVAPSFEKAKAAATAGSGIFNLLWLLTFVLMFLPAPV
mgnify:CR=1 FL=1